MPMERTLYLPIVPRQALASSLCAPLMPGAPTCEEVDALFADLETAAPTLNQATIESRLFSISKGLKRRAPILPAGSFLYRARVVEQPPQSKLQSAADLSYPRGKTVAAARCNPAGEPIFYGATHVNPCYFEARARVGSLLAISQWQLSRDVVLQPIGYTDGTVNQLGDARAAAGWGLIGQEPVHLRFEGHVRRLFTDPTPAPSTYRLSSIFAQMLMRGDRVDGVIYPSFAMKSNGENVALKTSVADQALKLTHAKICVVTDALESSFQSTTLDIAEISAAGSLRWKGPDEKWEIRKQSEELRVISDGYRWRAFDSSGIERPYDP